MPRTICEGVKSSAAHSSSKTTFLRGSMRIVSRAVRSSSAAIPAFLVSIEYALSMIRLAVDDDPISRVLPGSPAFGAARTTGVLVTACDRFDRGSHEDLRLGLRSAQAHQRRGRARRSWRRRYVRRLLCVWSLARVRLPFAPAADWPLLCLGLNERPAETAAFRAYYPPTYARCWSRTISASSVASRACDWRIGRDAHARARAARS